MGNAADFVPGETVILVSNRGPVERIREGDVTVTRRGAGGLVSALSPLATRPEVVWICNAISEADRDEAKRLSGSVVAVDDGRGKSWRLRLVETDPEAYRRFYSVIANPLLWFVQHLLWDLANVPDITADELDAFENGYLAVNQALAAAVDDELDRHGPDATVMIHDYQLYLVGALVRDRRPDVFLHHFVHVPWPGPDAWRVLPQAMRNQIVRGLLGNDVVAFHTEHDARNFLITCQELLDLPVDLSDMTVRVDSRIVAARWYPISIDPDALEADAITSEVAEAVQGLENLRREHLILRVDRTDLSKNILRGFKAFDQLLRDHPELTGRVTFLALLPPSRLDVPEYAEYMERIKRLVADVNLEHGNAEWQPIDLRVEDSMTQTLAAYQLFDVLFVNPVVDGLNLVAKEGMLLNRRDGVLVLSEHAGVYTELGSFCLSVHPFDIGAQASALWTALTMEPAERRARREACVDVIRANDVAKWLQVQLQDVRELRDGAGRSTIGADTGRLAG